MESKNKNSAPWEEVLIRKLQDEEFARDFLNDSLMEYVQGGSFNAFFKSLERVIKARMPVSQFAKEAEIDRTNLYALFNGKKKPQLKTVLKILAKLGYTLKIA